LTNYSAGFAERKRLDMTTGGMSDFYGTLTKYLSPGDAPVVRDQRHHEQGTQHGSILKATIPVETPKDVDMTEGPLLADEDLDLSLLDA
jgi:hypothetical protein